jgi:hypothetical protein
MCDYSLGGLPNRLAIEGEELITHRFPTHSIGLASPGELVEIRNKQTRPTGVLEWIKLFFAPAEECRNVAAVCIPPGASLVLEGIPTHIQQRLNVCETEPVVFVQTSAEVNRYRDAVKFECGSQILLQELTEGIAVKVLSLGGDHELDHERAEPAPRFA